MVARGISIASTICAEHMAVRRKYTRKNSGGGFARCLTHPLRLLALAKQKKAHSLKIGNECNVIGYDKLNDRENAVFVQLRTVSRRVQAKVLAILPQNRARTWILRVSISNVASEGLTQVRQISRPAAKSPKQRSRKQGTLQQTKCGPLRWR